jgi:hypothetical protein
LSVLVHLCCMQLSFKQCFGGRQMAPLRTPGGGSTTEAVLMAPLVLLITVGIC